MHAELKKELELVGGVGRSYVDAPAAKVGKNLQFRNKTLVDFSSGDVFNLSQHPKLKRLAHEALEKYPLAAIGPRRWAGVSEIVLQCETSLSKFFSTEAALLLTSRNQALYSLFATLVRERDVIFCDDDNAGVVSDLSTLTGADFKVLDFSDLNSSESALQGTGGGGRRFLFVSTVSPSSGQAVDMQSLSLAAQRHGCFLIADESAALGVLGSRGCGACETIIDVALRPLAIVSDLAQSFVTQAAVIASPSYLIETIKRNSKTMAAELAPSPFQAANILHSLDVVELAFAERSNILAAISRLQSILSPVEQRLRTSAFLTLRCDKFSRALRMQEELLQRGFSVDALPSPKGLVDAGFLKFMVSTEHAAKDIASIGQAMLDLLPLSRA